MHKAKDVWPKKWQQVIVLYDDGEYSVCWGMYEKNPRTMGKRWNDNFPRQGASPTWYIEYPLFVEATIITLINGYEIEEKNGTITPENKNYLDNCRNALKEIEAAK
ncbi:hypothetical protein NWE55_16650 (plasmid) [Myroides albus]|uniref:Uncharacterized protein n=1 Tax=Myroides odoratimimus TaxID=76832 RepID=A0AAI8C9I4_9FLAO|nr:MULTISPECIES: hypothetical protein [Myroides]ALU28455.1 hypothetical protein AS202_19940 [Myroides odoratimimus]UVD81373.1 hypothetical protein NWE55_17010 [Myroides albus]UVD81391.1 hypothetical protein NWE55_16650 [Myroides albus]